MTVNHFVFKNLVYLPVTSVRGEQFGGYLRALERSQWLTAQELTDLQQPKLNALIAAAAREVPFYRASLADGLQDGQAVSVETLPFISKVDLKEFQAQFLHPTPGQRLTRKTTGGSTGQAVTILKSREATAQETAGQWRGFRWAGVDIGYRQGRFWGVPREKGDQRRARLTDIICNRRRCSAFSFTEADMARYTDEMAHFNPDYLYGYVSMLSRYAEYLRDTGRRFGAPLTAIFTTAEVLTTTHRNLLEDVFQAPVFNEYGCGELGTIAHECEQHKLHINAENLLVEILDGDRPCEKGEVGEIVVTELNNLAMPLIRYRLGDFASFSGESCECGRGLPVIENVAGRAYDLVYNRDGEMFHGEFFMYIFEEIKRKNLGVEAFKVIQDDFDHFTVLVKPEPEFGAETVALISQRIQSGYGDYAQVEVSEVDRIEREASGKMRLIVGIGPPGQPA